MRCPSCGTENAADKKSCESCGTFLGPALTVDKPSEDEVPTHLGLAVVAAGLPLLCATGGTLALIAVPVGLFAVHKARSVEAHLAGRRRDALAATAASINAQRFALLAIVLAFVLSIGQFAYQATAVTDVVKRDIPAGDGDTTTTVEAATAEAPEQPAEEPAEEPAEPGVVDEATEAEEPAEDL